MPISLGYFLITAIIVVLQMIPLVGVALMIFAAPYWSIFTINAGFAGVAVEALARRNVSRWWLVLPFLWFGGYAAWIGYENVMVGKTAEVMRATNASRIAPLSGLDANLLLYDSNETTGEMVATKLLQQYDLSLVYVGDVESRGTWRAFRAGPKALCDSLPRDLAAADIRREDRPLRTSDAREAICLYSTLDIPDSQILVAQFGSRGNRQAPMGVTLGRVTLSTPGAKEIDLTTGSVQSLSWFPKPIVGCALNSNMAQWECFAKFDRGQPRDFFTGAAATDVTVSVIAEALSMEPRQTDPTPPDATLQASIDSVLAEKVAEARRKLEHSLANPDEDFDIRASGVLETRPDILTVYAAQMAIAVEQEFDEPQNPIRSQAYQRLLSKLSENDFASVRHRLDPLYAKGMALRRDQASSDMAIRLGRDLRNLSQDFPGQPRKVEVVDTAVSEATIKG